MIIKTFSNFEIFQQRRKKLKQLDRSGAIILFSGTEGYLDRFRPNSHFVYLTGYEEPESCAVIRTGANPEFTLFVRDRDPDVEVWDGERFGVDRAKTDFNADPTFPIQDLLKELPELLRGVDEIFYNLGVDADADKLVLSARKKAQQLDRRSGKALAAIKDPNELLGPLRMIKDSFEQQWMRESCEISARAHLNVMKNVKPGMNERQVQADLFYSFYQQQASREGYSSIIASGVNATTLHYRANNRQMQDGDLLLIDAGAEKNYYTADITRTYPVNGKFTKPQRTLYSAVLDVQKKLIDLVRPGFSLIELQEKACVLLTEQMVELGLLSGRVSDLVESKAFHKYYPHGVGHYLGMDVHDVGVSKRNEKPVPFVEGMVITVEPGLYVPMDDTHAPKELRGLGVRIEDDILILNSGPENMTQLAIKEIDGLESLINN